MYFKLAFRNAKRSISDYLLYITAMTVLLSVMCIGNCLALWGKRRANFQTASLPLLIVIVMTVLISYINHFMVKQRAKEFATYLLLGMNRARLSLLFICEMSFTGLACFIAGSAAGQLIFRFCSHFLKGAAEIGLTGEITGKSILYTFLYFCLIQLFSMFCMRRTVYKMQISQLMSAKHWSQPLQEKGKTFWLCLFTLSIGVFQLMLWGIVLLPDSADIPLISVISIPVLCCIFAFYKWMYAMLSSVRISCSEYLYEGDRLYRIAEMTSGAKTGAALNAVFSMCLLFSAASFLFGTLLLSGHIRLFSYAVQKWMAFLQISICIIFLVIYFSILSLLQIIALKRQARGIRVLHYMGRSRSRLRRLIKCQILSKLLFPALMCFVLLFSAVPAVNYRLNSLLPPPMRHTLLKSTAAFVLCFAALYYCYYRIIYVIGRRAL